VIVHLNGKLVAAAEAVVSPFDRGFLFGDGVYEGLRGIPCVAPEGMHEPWRDRRIIGVRGHVERMRNGLRLTGIAWDPEPLHEMSLELLAANGMKDGFVYWQVTRGTPGPGEPVRSRIASPTMKPTVFGYCTAQPSFELLREPACKTAITVEDRRWAMGHLKSISLMGNILGAMQTVDEECTPRADDAIFVRDGLLCEGLATNVVIALEDRSGGVRLATPSLESASILAGVTRDILLRERPEIEERAVTVEELRAATEVMLIGTTTMVTSVTELDGRRVGDGEAGACARSLMTSLLGAIRAGRDLDRGL